jgi:hypothetical protein
MKTKKQRIETISKAREKNLDIIYRKIRNRVSDKDCLQTSVIKFLECYPDYKNKFKTGNDIKGMLLKIYSNSLKDGIKKSFNHNNVSLNDLLKDSDIELIETIPAQKIDHDQDLSILIQHCIKSDLIRSIVLNRLSDKSWHEIAENNKISIDTCQRKFKKGIQAIKNNHALIESLQDSILSNIQSQSPLMITDYRLTGKQREYNREHGLKKDGEKNGSISMMEPEDYEKKSVLEKNQIHQSKIDKQLEFESKVKGYDTLTIKAMEGNNHDLARKLPIAGHDAFVPLEKNELDIEKFDKKRYYKSCYKHLFKGVISSFKAPNHKPELTTIKDKIIYFQSFLESITNIRFKDGARQFAMQENNQ